MNGLAWLSAGIHWPARAQLWAKWLVAAIVNLTELIYNCFQNCCCTDELNAALTYRHPTAIRGCKYVLSSVPSTLAASSSRQARGL